YWLWLQRLVHTESQHPGFAANPVLRTASRAERGRGCRIPEAGDRVNAFHVPAGTDAGWAPFPNGGSSHHVASKSPQKPQPCTHSRRPILGSGAAAPAEVRYLDQERRGD